MTIAEYLTSLKLSRGRAALGPSNKSTYGLVEPGNIINLYNRPVMQQPTGEKSTTLSTSFNFDGKEVLLPTVVGGRLLTNREAVDRFMKTGQHLGMFSSPSAANSYAEWLHRSQEAMGGFYGPVSRK